MSDSLFEHPQCHTPEKKMMTEYLSEKEIFLHAVVRRVLPHTGSSPAKAGSTRGRGQSSADQSCLVNSDSVRRPENT